MFCTTFLSAPSEEFLESVSRPDGRLVPLRCLVLSGDELKASLLRSRFNTLLKLSGDGPSISTEDVLSGHTGGHRKLMALARGRGLAALLWLLTVLVKKWACAPKLGRGCEWSFSWGFLKIWRQKFEVWRSLVFAQHYKVLTGSSLFDSYVILFYAFATKNY